MPKSRHVDSGSIDGLGVQYTSRRKFLGSVSLFSLMALAGSTLLGACTRPLLTPPTTESSTMPPAVSPATVLEALKNRKSTNAFQTQPLTKEKLLELLWAAWGINRPDSGKRTAPSAMNAQEIDIYALLPEAVYVYDAKVNQLTPVSTQDLRPKTQGFMRDAPVHLVFVADYAKFRTIPQSQKELYSAAHTGFIGQNVYLYCASQGLGAHFYASIDRDVMKDSLQLREDQAIVFAQAVGYPKE